MQCGEKFTPSQVTWREFAHHCTWDEFLSVTDPQSFYYFAHFARDNYLLPTVGFERSLPLARS